LERGDGPEGTLIEGEEAARGVSLGDDHERRAGQPEPQVAVAGDDVASRPELGPVQALDDERALGQVLEEGELDVRPQPIEDQAVRLGTASSVVTSVSRSCSRMARTASWRGSSASAWA